MILPNIRKLFIPDPGYLMCDADLDRADLQVVVWEADEPDLKRMLKLGVDLHIMNGVLINGDEPPPEDELIEGHPEYPEHKKRYSKARVFAKAFVHGTNYGGKARTMGATAGITTHQAERLQARWFSIYPGIKDWHDRTEDSLRTTRCVKNAFGFRRFYFDRIDAILPEALAWVPQSTVANVINKGLLNIHRNLPLVHILLQVHDSLVFQLPLMERAVLLPKVRDELLIEIPYEDPLTIPVGVQVSDKSWGDVKQSEWR